MTPTDAIDWCIRRNADAPTCARLREILPAVAAADATNRALLERVADLEKQVAHWRKMAEIVETIKSVDATLDTFDAELGE